MPSLLPTYTTREEHVKNQRADLMYRIITNKNKDKIVWSILSENPNAGELLRERVEFEEKLPKKKYNEITNYNKLNWHFLSSNPSIFTY
jgi:hypothetical protein